MAFNYRLLGNVRFGNELEDILKLKGIENVDLFLNPTEENIEKPILIENLYLAAETIHNHLENNSEIDLLVDCDCDGFTSAANIYMYLKRLKSDIQMNPIIHEKKIHGLSDVVDVIANSNSKLVIIPDASSGDVDECKLLIAKGKDVVILDHHNIRDKNTNEIPNNPAIVANNQYSDNLTNKSLTGVGITYKLTKVLDLGYNKNYADDYLDLFAVGMIGDRCSIKHPETRFLIDKALKQMNEKTNTNKMIRTMLDYQSYSMRNRVTINGIAFYICPLINSLIRLGTTEDKLNLFKALCNSDEQIIRKVRGKGEVLMSIQEYSLKDCISSNTKQKKLTEETTQKLLVEINKYGLDKLPIIVCNAKDYVELSSIGLIANKIASIFSKPCLLMRSDGNSCKGSGRGCPKSGIADFNKWCVETSLFTRVEGHPNAFGVEIDDVNKTNLLFDKISQEKANNEVVYFVYNKYDKNNIHSDIIKNIVKYNYLWGNDLEEPIFLIEGIPVNIFNIHLTGSKNNLITFMYHNIKFQMRSKYGTLADKYREIKDVGENVVFDVIGRFDIYDGTPIVDIEDFDFRKGEKTNPFGG